MDDDQDSLHMMQAALEYVGALVTAVPTAKKAFEILGRGFARELQKVPSLRSVPILAVAGDDDLYVRRELHDAGFIGILRKPVTFPDLIRTVAALADAGRSEGQ